MEQVWNGGMEQIVPKILTCHLSPVSHGKCISASKAHVLIEPRTIVNSESMYGTMGMERRTDMLFDRYGTGYGTRCSRVHVPYQNVLTHGHFTRLVSCFGHSCWKCVENTSTDARTRTVQDEILGCCLLETRVSMSRCCQALPGSL